MPKKIYILLIFSLVYLESATQINYSGQYPVKNYEKKEYTAGTQNWEIDQSENGLVYFANNSGLLQFDGTYWKLFPISNQTIVRSVSISKDGKIYVGGQGEFGYFYPEKNGELIYRSLVPLVPDNHKNFTDVWDIEITDDGVFFKSGEAVFKIFGDLIDVFTFENIATSLWQSDGRVFLLTGNDEIWEYHMGNFQKFQTLDIVMGRISGQIQNKNGHFVTSLSTGIFKLEKDKWIHYQTDFDEQFKSEFAIYAATSLPSGKTVIGSPPKGLLIFSENWELEYIANKRSGLQNNSVLSLKPDSKGNLWLGLDNGIDYFEANSAITTIFPDGELGGTGYTAQIFENKLYLGTNHGLFLKKENSVGEENFKFIEGTTAQVWGLSEVNGRLFLGHHTGAFEIISEAAKNIGSNSGTWLFLPLNKTQIIIGQYGGLGLAELQNNNWIYTQKMDGLAESSRILIKESDNLFWMAHPYRGIFKVSPNTEEGKAYFQFYDSNHGLPSNQFNHVFKVNDKPLFTSETGVFEYNPDADKFDLYKPLASFFDKNARIKTLREDSNGNIWFAADSEVGVLKINDSGLERKIEKVIYPELSDKLVNGFEFIYPYDEANIIIGSEEGFIHLNPEKYALKDTSHSVLISEIRLITQDTVLYNVSISESDFQIPVLTEKQNNIVFKYTSPVFNLEKEIQYQTKLEGSDTDWTPWTHKTEREFSNLRPGDYIFKVRSKNAGGNLSSIKEFSFEIAPPWYASNMALFIWSLLGTGLIFGLFFRQKSKFETEKAELESEHLKKEAEHIETVEQSEAEIQRLRNENLQSEVNHKTKELASATMHLVQKNKMLIKIQSELNKVIRNPELNKTTKSEVRRLINLLTQDQILNDDWKQFEVHFDKVHHDFLKRLRKEYPNLSPNDFKLCAYLRMNLSTKEIAPLLNISVRGVEASRYRLRKKLNLNNEQNLIEFMMNI